MIQKVLLIKIMMIVILASCVSSTLSDATKNSFTISVGQGEFPDKIVVNWFDMEFYKNYLVLRSNSRYGEYSALGPKVQGDVFEDYSIQVGQEYFYQIKAFNKHDICVFTTVVASGYAGNKVFSAPKEVIVTVTESLNQLVLVWDKVSGAVSYDIWRSTDNERFKCIARSWCCRYEEDTNISPKETYYYQISSVDQEGLCSQDRSSSVVGSLLRLSINLNTHCGKFSDKIQIEWNPAAEAEGYVLYKSEDIDCLGSEIVQCGNEGPFLFEDYNVQSNQFYYYTLVFTVQGIKYSSEVARGYLNTLQSPCKPNNVQAAQGIDPTQVHISWNQENAITHYEIYRSERSQGPWVFLQKVAGCHYDDTPPNDEYVYYYKVIGVNGDVFGEESDVVSGWTNKPPFNIVASEDLGSKIVLQWNAVPNAWIYHIYYADSATGSFTKIKDIVAINDNRRCVFEHHAAVKNGEKKEMFYKISVTVYGRRTSHQSEVVRGAIEQMKPPTGLRVLHHNMPTKSIQLVWNMIDVAKEYRIYQATLAHRGASGDALNDSDFKLIGSSRNPNYTVSYNKYPIRRYMYEIRPVDFSDTEGKGARTGVVWRLPVDAEDFMKDVDLTIIQAQTQIPNFGNNGSSSIINARAGGNYNYAAGLATSMNQWNAYTSFEITLTGSPGITIHPTSMSASMDGSVAVTGLFSGSVTYHSLDAKNGGIVVGGSMSATYNHPTLGPITKRWSAAEAGGILQSVVLSPSQKPSYPQYEKGGGI